MLDVTAVGSNLTPEQQEATMADLAFFLDEFGSTRAVRVKLHEQQRDIQRLGSQVQRLVNGRGGEEDKNGTDDEEIAVERNQNDLNDVDEIMADVDFFLRVYGSTRAARHELYTQSQKLANLQTTIRYFQRQQGLQNERIDYDSKAGDLGENEDGKLGSTSAATLVQKVAENEQQNGGGETNQCPRGASSWTVRRRASHVTCKILGCMKWVKRHGDPNEYCARHRAAFASRDDRPNALMQSEKTKDNNEDDGGKAGVGGADGEKIQGKKPDDISTETQNEKSEKRGCRARQFSANEDLGVSGMIAAYYNQLKSAVTGDSRPSGVSDDSDSRELTKPQPESTKISPMTIKQTETVDYGKAGTHAAGREAPSSPRRSSHNCRHPGCTKNPQAHGLCWAHGGYYICKVDGCTRRAPSRKLCRNHGGGTRCKFSECDKFSVSSGKGYCYRHAREQGIEVNHSSKGSGLYGPRAGKIQHGSEDDANGFLTHDHIKKELRKQTFENGHHTTRDSGQTTSTTSAFRCRPRHVTCKAFKCMKWVMRDGDLSEYCAIHRGAPGLDDGNSRASIPNLATFIHQENNEVSTDANAVEIITSKG
ncbi:hypothetical protein PC129_g3913 [Phytophthora cactorum]|uniref:WRKY19-like zinc finger domain-containing protein n=1 Tax=Phytophthora cactorum TaxID=29920 RepID=A0A329SFV4_9STRA|nr:hypothetical protein Pcac1_g22722 [Phytophthora cactorum]KAG3225450.1 hypothetical protein PC129_g3913 [Phytophthora cactorum]KAG4247546.1 hypothetical protein PC116_g4707 [Phytophthora cactorum]RAW34976.1 hypothetical protein PC110_g8724 [Phytophthora cactorum]